MTMFKTDEYIEKFAKLLTDQMEMENYTKEQVCIAIEEVLKDFQKDLLESASKGKEEAWVNYRKGEGHSFGHKEALEYGWQAAKLSSKSQIDTLKQRELEYQSDLRQKDAEIDRLKKKISSFDAYASADEKYQEAVKDIEWILADCDRDLYTHLEKIDEIKTKYGLNKQESKE